MTQTYPDALFLPLTPVAKGVLRLSGSKSISNRALLLAALSTGRTTLHGLLESDDTAVMLDSLSLLGIRIEKEQPADGGTPLYHVNGQGGGFPNLTADLFVGNSGLTIRTLVPALIGALHGREGCITLHGVPRMHERPIGDLVDGLRQLGADIRYLGQEGYPPLELRGARLAGDVVKVAGDTSSQFITGLLQMAPLFARTAPLNLVVTSPLISKPYVAMTIKMMQRFGVKVDAAADFQSFTVGAGQSYRAIESLYVEGDASSASYFLAAGVLGGGVVRVEGVGKNSIQGDIHFADALQAMGGGVRFEENAIETFANEPLRAIEWDCNAIPDAAMTLAILALFAKGTTKLLGIGSWRVKETDRLAAMAAELRKLGAIVEEGADWIAITPPVILKTAEIKTYDDHRMAMCFALVSLGGVGLTILDPKCVAKTFPTYWQAFAALTGA